MRCLHVIIDLISCFSRLTKKYASHRKLLHIFSLIYGTGNIFRRAALDNGHKFYKLIWYSNLRLR